MNKNMNEKENKNQELLIGILLLMPIYMIIFVILNFLNLNVGENTLLIPVLMYSPIALGIILSYKTKPEKVSKIVTLLIITFFFIAIYFYYDAYCVEHSGWDGLAQAFLWLINTALCKIFACIFYGKFVGWKKAISFFAIYVLVIVSSFALGFWA